MRYYRQRCEKHIEDNFDLEKYKEDSIKAVYEENYKKNEANLKIVQILIGIFSIPLALAILDAGNRYISSLRIKKISNEITEIVQVSASDNRPTNLQLFDTNETSGEEEVPEIQVLDTTNIKKEIIPGIQNLISMYQNNDIIAYIKIDDTKVKAAVVKYTDNDFYLEHDLSKNPNKAGSIYMDCDNRIDDFSDNTILYGHNMKDGTMFADVKSYNDEYFYKTHKYIEFVTLYEITKWEVFSFYSTPTTFDYLKTDFESKSQFKSFLDEIKSKSIYVSDSEITPDDKILTLSTCTNTADDMRYVVHAKLIEKKLPDSNSEN